VTVETLIRAPARFAAAEHFRSSTPAGRQAVGRTTTTDGCRTCIEEDAKLDAERQQALRALDIADHEVNRARARLADLDNRIAYRREVKANRGAKP
jgi:hypothetical protein